MAPAWMTGGMDIGKFDGIATGGWDWQSYARMLDEPRLRTLQPALARAIHTGRLAGEYCTPQFHDQAFDGLPLYGGGGEKGDHRLLPAAGRPRGGGRHPHRLPRVSAPPRGPQPQRAASPPPPLP